MAVVSKLERANGPTGEACKHPDYSPQGSLRPSAFGVCHPSMPHAQSSAQKWLAVKIPGGCSWVFVSIPSRTATAVHVGDSRRMPDYLWFRGIGNISAHHLNSCPVNDPEILSICMSLSLFSRHVHLLHYPSWWLHFLFP